MEDIQRGDIMADFHEELAQESLAPLWEVLKALVPREPRPVAAPAHWSFDLLRKFALQAGKLITAEQAERRVIVLENPALRGQSQITTSLYAGVQLILPGEVAPTHRHTASALRLLLEGEGGYTIVDGERVEMHPGDFIITPTWSLHDHGSDSDQPVIWLDGLDVPIVKLLNAGFAEDSGNGRQTVVHPEGDSLARYGSGLTPVNYIPKTAVSPIFWYPYARTREALERMRQRAEWDPAEGLRLTFTDPTTGGSPIQTMAAFMQLLPAGFSGSEVRSTDGAVYSVVEGSGRVTVGDITWEVKPRDIFVVPGWAWHRLAAETDLILFSFSDRPLQQKLGFWREQRG
ncbi:gentisate 1,2-dioxygenase [Acidocella aminolytica]|uniref:Gentisate 1,2-dioxygenase n=1 Tax=Acidocella aminolytica 101 = DSM 11237 TaxID=1120923 RepID=A0A0D6PGN6_9PROT|nr:gentisate 1,2-dioxygenase [Acidocella aminolytica]GAN80541.1 gentisate 1,2-dioxygenase [Acidocella aminolytica 101 = DSM 11237]GBQ43021.1 gentisate 1,2-dioxygenase [Acidocella aminolytica 101 = DSM 11237]SHE29282.1 gentisate 1,2-dioxygenase [Acidocella aminolytica 101 = DSM 11237]